MFFEAGVMIHSGFFSLAGTAVKVSGTDAQPDAAGGVLRGLGNFFNKQKIAFVTRKPCLQKSGSKLNLFAIKIIISSEKQHNKGSH